MGCFCYEPGGPQISPLRFAPVEMTKGRGALPGRIVAGRGVVSVTNREDRRSLHYASLRSRCQRGEGRLREESLLDMGCFCHEPGGPQISPLRFAPVEMTKGRG